MGLPQGAMIIAHGKHDTELFESALQMLTQRSNEGIYYDDWNDGNASHQWAGRARAIMTAAHSTAHEAGDPAAREVVENAAMRFLEERQDFEYEGFEVKHAILRPT